MVCCKIIFHRDRSTKPRYHLDMVFQSRSYSLQRELICSSSKGAVTEVSILKADKADVIGDVGDSGDRSSFDQVHAMMTKVVQPGGTGHRAAVKGFDVAGKTGTSYIANGSGYDTHRYVASFAGFAPAQNPDYVVAVALWEPQGVYHFGGTSAAPLFGKIMQHMLLFKSSKNALLSHKEGIKISPYALI